MIRWVLVEDVRLSRLPEQYVGGLSLVCGELLYSKRFYVKLMGLFR